MLLPPLLLLAFIFHIPLQAQDADSSRETTSRAYAKDALRIGSRLGDKVDQYEREYFGLFPDVSHFVDARLERITQDSLVFLITRDSGNVLRDTAITISNDEFHDLIDALEDYERSFGTWSCLSLARRGIIDNTRVPALNTRGSETVVLDSSALRGKILSIIDSTCFFWDSSEPFSANILDSCRRIAVSAIRSIIHHEAGSFLKGASIGFLVGAIPSFFLFQFSNTGGDRQGHDDPDLGLSIAWASAIGVLWTGLPGGLLSMVLGWLDSEEVLLASGMTSGKRDTLRRWCMFPDLPPPEIRGYLTGGESSIPASFASGMGRVKQTRNAPDLKRSLFLEYMTHYYGSAHHGMEAGLGFSLELPVSQLKDSLYVFSIRPCLSGGYQYFLFGLDGKVLLNYRIQPYLILGLNAYFSSDLDISGWSDGQSLSGPLRGWGEGYSFDQKNLLQYLAVSAGFGMQFTSIFAELHVRQLLKGALMVEHWSYDLSGTKRNVTREQVFSIGARVGIRF